MAEPPRWVLVTGASRGIGAAIAEALALGPDRFHVVVNYRSGSAAAGSVLARVRAAGGSAEDIAFDVADRAACAAAAASLLERLQAPWGVVNNAGITRDKLLTWMQPEDWDAVIGTNLDGFFNVTRPLIKPMLLARRGRIVNVTSTAGQVGSAGQVNYSAAKAGLIGATLALAKEVAKRGITVNAVAPGFIDSDMTAALPRDRLLPAIPMHRFGRAAEVASLVCYLMGDAASYVTGQVLGVNGGLA